MLSRLLTVVFAVVVVGSMTAVADAVAVDREDFVVVGDTDVFVQDEETGQLTSPTQDTPPETPIFNIVGTRLPVTWGQWSSATAKSLVKTKSRTDVDLAFAGLIPGGVYSVFYTTFNPDSRNAFCDNVREVALKARHPQKQLPDASSFVADAAGFGEFRGEAEGALLDSDTVVFRPIYHFDGNTYGEFSNYGDSVACRSSLGADAMRHLLVFQKFS